MIQKPPRLVLWRLMGFALGMLSCFSFAPAAAAVQRQFAFFNHSRYGRLKMLAGDQLTHLIRGDKMWEEW